jgi:hypothetical protein
MKITINASDIKRIEAEVYDIVNKQMPYAAKLAVDNTAFDVMKDEVKALDQYLDRPTPFTERAFEVNKSTKANLSASVRIRPLQARYLAYQIKGGIRTPLSKAIILPSAIPLDQYGNMQRTMVKSLFKSKATFSGRAGKNKAPGLYQRTEGRGLKMIIAYEPRVSYTKRLPFYDVANATVRRVFAENFRRATATAVSSARR